MDRVHRYRPEHVEALAPGPIAVSRGLPPSLRRELAGIERLHELPLVRGRAVVVRPSEATLLLGHPNHLGVYEQAVGERAVFLTGRWSELQPLEDGAMSLAIEEARPRARARVALETARRLAKRLRQWPGIDVAIPPKCPVIVALTARSLGNACDRVPGLTALGEDYPEYPGGVRIEIPDDVTPSRLDRYAAELEQCIVEAR